MAPPDTTLVDDLLPVKVQIRRAALRVIAAEGIGGITNRRVAKEAGVSLGSITYYFESQSELLRESLLLFVADETARLYDIVASRRDKGVLGLEEAAELVEQVARGITFERGEIAALELLVHAGRDTTLREAAGECFAAYDELARTVLRGLGLPERYAGSVVALIAGLQLRRLATGGTGDTGIAEALTMLVRDSR